MPATKQQLDVQGEIIMVAEIERRYPDEWVLLEITRDHKNHVKKVGRLLGHSRNRDELDEPFNRFRAAHPNARTYEFYTGDIVPKGFVAVL
ncbi:MAG: hypothetical protein ACRDJN_02105 [Chloroflexota bacterium]